MFWRRTDEITEARRAASAASAKRFRRGGDPNLIATEIADAEAAVDTAIATRASTERERLAALIARQADQRAVALDRIAHAVETIKANAGTLAALDEKARSAGVRHPEEGTAVMIRDLAERVNLLAAGDDR